MGDDRPAVYREDDGSSDGGGRWVFRASSFGNLCTTAALGYMLGFGDLADRAVPVTLQRAFDAGHAYEDEIVRRAVGMEHDGKLQVKLVDPWDLSITQVRNHEPAQMPGYAGVWGTPTSNNPEGISADDGQVRVEVPGPGGACLIRCHLDGIVQVFSAGVVESAADMAGRPMQLGDRAVLEVKFLGPDYWAKMVRGGLAALGDGYRVQVDVQQMGTGMPVLFVAAEKLPHMSTSGGGYEIGEVRSEWVFPDVARHAQVRVRMARLMAQYRKLSDAGVRDWGELPACDKTMWPCDFWREHPSKEEVAEARREVLMVAGAVDAAGAEVLDWTEKVAVAPSIERDMVALFESWRRDDASRARYDKLSRDAKKKADAARDELQLGLGAAGLGLVGRTIRVGGITYRYSETPVAEKIIKAYTLRKIHIEGAD